MPPPEPVDRVVLPGGWTRRRSQWEYSHAAGAWGNLDAVVEALRAARRGGRGSIGRAAQVFELRSYKEESITMRKVNNVDF